MAARLYRTRRSAAFVIAVVAAVLFALATLVGWRSPEVSRAMAWTYLADAAVWIPWVAIGALIAVRGVRTDGSTMLALAIAAIGFNGALQYVPTILGQSGAWLRAVDAVSAFVAAGAYLRASQLFPRALTREEVLLPEARWRWAPWLARFLAALLRPWAAWAIAALWLGLSLIAGPYPTTLAGALLILLGAAFWRVHARVGSRKVRHRVTWILQTAVVFATFYMIIVALMMLLKAAGVSQDVRAYVFVAYSIALAIAGCGSLAMAAFSAGAFNPTLVVRATLVYAVSATLLLFTLNVIASVIVEGAVSAFGLDDRLIAACLGAIAGLLVEPLAKTIQRLLGAQQPTPE